MLYTVVTTIAPPTSCIEEFSRIHDAPYFGQVIVVGDQKGPDAYDLNNCCLLSLSEQKILFPKISDLLPLNHYSRKNLGYLMAMREGADCIYETDDDNRPNQFWEMRSLNVKKPKIVNASGGWVNVYRYFTDEHVWPRGLPLDKISQEFAPIEDSIGDFDAPIQQGLVDNSADVDAVWRLILDRTFYFNAGARDSVLIPKNVWSPFNTQSTWWWPVAYPLMYIPSNCSFRMCDIWKSFVAQRCLWALGFCVVYHAPEVIQERNEHDLMKDFLDEIPGYLENDNIAQYLSGANLKAGQESVVENLKTCYKVLVEKEVFPRIELDLVDAWCDSVSEYI